MGYFWGSCKKQQKSFSLETGYILLFVFNYKMSLSIFKRCNSFGLGRTFQLVKKHNKIHQ